MPGLNIPQLRPHSSDLYSSTRSLLYDRFLGIGTGNDTGNETGNETGNDIADFILFVVRRVECIYYYYYYSVRKLFFLEIEIK